ncbi:MAG: hypothetical protein Q4D98_05245 [Planctomycetia bacterium]|nr:hypothetical protein [Planctomycetia bacterium]
METFAPLPSLPASGVFVLLQHETSDGVHWDLILDVEGAKRLPTWRFSVPPNVPGADATCRRNFDHRRMYLTYSGPVHGDRGYVVPWATGTYQCIEKTDRFWKVELVGSFPNPILSSDTSCRQNTTLSLLVPALEE